jgi:hypothetical protein
MTLARLAGLIGQTPALVDSTGVGDATAIIGCDDSTEMYCMFHVVWPAALIELGIIVSGACPWAVRCPAAAPRSRDAGHRCRLA